jgi:F-type H+-transporting ATPase subunit gamma
VRLDELRARIYTAGELREIASTMRVLSETRLRQAQRSVGSAEAYADEVQHALERALALVGDGTQAPADGGAPAPRRAALVVLGSEHGFVGGLNERVAAAGLSARDAAPGALVLVGGSRFARTAHEHGLDGEAQAPLAATLGAIGRTARALTDLVADGLARGELATVTVVSARRRGATEWQVGSDVVFPVAPPARGGPAVSRLLHHLPPRVLVARLVLEHVFARITAAVAEAFACEQAARVRALDATRRSLDGQLDELRQRERVARQEQVTSELLEVVAGAAALARPSPEAPRGGSAST